MAHKTDAEIIATTHNIGRFFTEHRQVAWVLLLGTFLWGWYGYQSMPQRKDPNIPVRVAVAICSWPGATARQMEQLVTRPMEEAIAQNQTVHPPAADEYGIKSTTLPGISIVTVQLAESVSDTKRQFSDINLKLNALNARLPDGAGPIQFQSDFGDTAALMLTVASPPADRDEIAVRAQAIERAIREARKAAGGRKPESHISIVVCFPESVSPEAARRAFGLGVSYLEQEGLIRAARIFEGSGYIGSDGVSSADEGTLIANIQRFSREKLHQSEIHPDAWPPVIIRDPKETQAKIASVAGAKYSYRELDDFANLIGRTVLGAPQVSKVDHTGVLPQAVFLDYSQQRMASYGLQPADLKNALGARNIVLPGGTLEVGSKNILINPSGEFTSAASIGNVIVGTSNNGSPVYLRDLVDINRGYQSPPQFLNFYTWRGPAGKWHRSRAVTLALFMRSGEQIQRLGESVDAKLEAVRQLLPKDLIIARTSDQPLQVKENIDLFMDALYEAIILVVVVSLFGFWDWRSAFLMALSIPITLAMTFGSAYILGIDLQQVSIATLIIALGLLVDDPVVAGDAIKNQLAAGKPRGVAAWLGPTRLARAIWFATITNVAAYLPFLLLTGNTGDFLYSLPIVMACALLSSAIVALGFVPLVGYYVLRPRKKRELTIEERRQTGFTGAYYRLAGRAIDHRWMVFTGSLLFLVLGVYLFGHLKQQFFPDDVQYWATVDVWLPNDAPLSVTNQTAQRVEDVIRATTAQYGREHTDRQGRPREILHSLTTFVGGGGPRFWFSVTPELQQLNYAQVVMQVDDKEDMPRLAGPIQTALTAQVPGAIVDLRQLQTNPVEMPIAIRISGKSDVTAAEETQDIRTLRSLARQVEDIFRSVPGAARVRNDWFPESFTVNLQIDPDRANLAGVTNLDVAQSSTAAMSGMPVAVLREGDKQIPVLVRLRMEERAQLSDIRNLYVNSSEGTQKVPLLEISSIENTFKTQKIKRLEHFRTVTVECFPAPGKLASEVLNAALPRLMKFQQMLPPGYSMQIAGEQAAQERGFKELAVVLTMSLTLIYLALVIQFNHAVKPFLVFAAAPYGVVGSLLALAFMGSPFSFMAFLGIASLIGVIVSHVIVLFDFIEEMHEKGEPVRQALLDAGIARLRPVMITVLATITALFPLALHGGPLWQPLCYTQIGGLAVATFITLLLVPVLYSIFVLDLKLIQWDVEAPAPIPAGPSVYSGEQSHA
jgi:multidrug efflux pump